MTQIVSFINMKGGVGKTTLAVNVAYGLAQIYKKKVLIVDADPQFNATQYLVEENTYLKHIKADRGTLSDIFMPRRVGGLDTVSGKAEKKSRSTMSLAEATINIFDGGVGRGRLDLIPSTLQLIEIETSKRGTENKLKKFLATKATDYDYVIIDCPPTISIFTQAAILASDKYLVPVKPDPLSVIGLPLLERWLAEFVDDNGLDIDAIGLVFTLVRGPTPRRMQEVMDDLRSRRPKEVFTEHFSQATCVAKSVEEHLPVFLHNHREKAAKQVVKITNEFLERTTGA